MQNYLKTPPQQAMLLYIPLELLMSGGSWWAVIAVNPVERVGRSAYPGQLLRTITCPNHASDITPTLYLVKKELSNIQSNRFRPLHSLIQLLMSSSGLCIACLKGASDKWFMSVPKLLSTVKV